MEDDLVSVVIPCYNQSHFLGEAINSVLQQTWSNIEIIVVDDGSTDATSKVASQYGKVKYVYQGNQGLSQARNIGIRNSLGKFLIMLDADDWLFPDAIAINIQYLINNPSLAFVSGAYVFVDQYNKVISKTYNPIVKDHYLELLKRNYIGSPAAVMYQRWVFDAFSFDKAVDACSDYDIYLKVARTYPVLHHTTHTAAYRIHGLNMSSNIPLMLSTALVVLQNQEKFLKGKTEEKAINKGKINLNRYYSAKLLDHLFNSNNRRIGSAQEIKILFKNMPWLLKKCLYKICVNIKSDFL